MNTRRPVEVKVVLFGLDRTAGTLTYHVVRGALPNHLAPDAHALALAGLNDGQAGAVCHSTSWRCHDGAVILTYAATAQPIDSALAGCGAPLHEPSVVCSDDPLRPSPTTLHAHHIAAHAARHLAYLA